MDHVEVIEHTDPGSVWAWGAEPSHRSLRWRFGHLLRWRTVVGVMTERAGAPRAVDVRGGTDAVVARWADVHRTTGMPHTQDLRDVPLSTAGACQAVTAARLQGDEIAERVLRRMREWLFVVGEPYDTTVALVAAVSGVPGLDIDDYVNALDDPVTLVALERDRDEARRPTRAALEVTDTRPGNGRVRPGGDGPRFAFPSLVLRGPAGEATVAGWHPLAQHEAALETVAPGILGEARRPPSTDEVLVRWGCAADVELAVLCGPGGTDPAGAVVHRTSGGALYMTPTEARARGLGKPA